VRVELAAERLKVQYEREDKERSQDHIKQV
jgi:hypothetical protein